MLHKSESWEMKMWIIPTQSLSLEDSEYFSLSDFLFCFMSLAHGLRPWFLKFLEWATLPHLKALTSVLPSDLKFCPCIPRSVRWQNLVDRGVLCTLSTSPLLSLSQERYPSIFLHSTYPTCHECHLHGWHPHVPQNCTPLKITCFVLKGAHLQLLLE